MSVPVIISDASTREILDANASARALLGESITGKKVPGVYALSPHDIQIYNSLNAAAFSFDFMPVRLHGGKDEYVFDSAYLSVDDDVRELVRIDTLTLCGDDDLPSYYCKNEIASHMQQWGPAGCMTEQAQVMAVLRAALFVYAADRAFVVEYDKNLECLEDVYSLFRTGYSDRIGRMRPIGRAGVEMFDEMWKAGRPVAQRNYIKSEESEILQPMLYEKLDSWSNMIVPFKKELGIRCFLCIDNVRRHWGNTSVLSNLTNLIANVMFSTRLAQSTSAARHLSAELSHVPEKAMRIYLFGGVRIETSLGMENDMNLLSSQCGTFFVYLLSNRQRLVPVRELADVLWPDEFIDDPYNMIKNVAFRTRKMFDNIVQERVIVAGNGTYRINSALEIWLDIEEFERQFKRASDTNRSDYDRLAACEKAFKLYSGAMLPNLDCERWLVNRICYYQLMYAQLVQTYTMLLEKKGDCMTMFDVVAKATEIELLDSSVHITLLGALLKNNKAQLAKRYYSRIRDQLTAEENGKVSELWKEFK